MTKVNISNALKIKLCRIYRNSISKVFQRTKRLFIIQYNESNKLNRMIQVPLADSCSKKQGISDFYQSVVGLTEGRIKHLIELFYLRTKESVCSLNRYNGIALRVRKGLIPKKELLFRADNAIKIGDNTGNGLKSGLNNKKKPILRSRKCVIESVTTQHYCMGRLIGLHSFRLKRGSSICGQRAEGILTVFAA